MNKRVRVDASSADDWYALKGVEGEKCEHNGYTIRNICNSCGKFLTKEESDKCCTGG